MFMLTFHLADAASAANYYIAPPIACRLIDATFTSSTAATVADETITLGDGTTTAGTITVAYSGAAIGDVDSLSYSDEVELDRDTPLKIAVAGTSTSTVGTLLLVFSEYHAG